MVSMCWQSLALSFKLDHIFSISGQAWGGVLNEKPMIHCWSWSKGNKWKWQGMLLAVQGEVSSLKRWQLTLSKVPLLQVTLQGHSKRDWSGGFKLKPWGYTLLIIIPNTFWLDLNPRRRQEARSKGETSCEIRRMFKRNHLKCEARKGRAILANKVV